MPSSRSFSGKAPRKVKGRGLRVGALLCAGLVVAGALPAAAYQRPGRTERVSVASDGSQADGTSSGHLSISADGRHVAFMSAASNLVPGDTNQCPGPPGNPSCDDVFVRDRLTGRTERVSVSSDGEEANNWSLNPSISADGRYVAFQSLASNLVPGDTNGGFDMFVHDRETGKTERVSVASDGAEANSWSQFPSISGDGRYVAFTSNAFNLVPGDTNNTQDIFVHDRETGKTERVSVASDGTEAGGPSVIPFIGADGSAVAFHSFARNLGPLDTNGTWDVFVHDRVTRETERVSVASDGSEATGISVASGLSGDGRLVVFRGGASNLVPRDTNDVQDVFVHDRETGRTERVSVASDGTEGNAQSGLSSIPRISIDGRYVSFDSEASNLVGDGVTTTHAFVHDRLTRTTERVSVASGGAPGTGASRFPAVSADGRFATFASSSSNLVPGDTNARTDVFVRDRGPSVGAGEVSVSLEDGRMELSGWATFSPQVVSSATDPADDALPGAAVAGGELTGASIVHRVEREDLLVRLDLASMPGPAIGGAPGVLYGLEFRLAGTRYEVRALRASATEGPSADPHLALHRCDPSCTERARLPGAIGTTGPEVLVSIPRSTLDFSGGADLEDVRAFTALGEAGPGSLLTLDEVDLADAVVSGPRVSLGVVPAGTPAEQIAFDTEATLADGAFSGVVDASSLPPGEYEAWARACLGEVCGTSSVAFRP